MFKTIKNAINNTIDATIINAFTILSRYFVTLDPVLNSSYEMAQPITFAGDFEIEVEYSSSSTVDWEALVGDDTTTDGIQFTNLDKIRVRPFDIIFTPTIPRDGSLRKLKITRNGTLLSLFLDGALLDTAAVTSNSSMQITQVGSLLNSNYFDGIIANAKFTDKSGASDVVTTFRLDNSPAAANYVYGGEEVTNGDFSNGTANWDALSSASLSVSQGALRITNVGANYGKATQQINTITGKTYELTFNGISRNIDSKVRVGTTPTGTDLLSNVTWNIGYNRFVFITSTTAPYVTFVGDGIDGSFIEIDNVSVKEITNYTEANAASEIEYSQENVFGAEEVVNGDFATDSDWTKGTGWSISNGVALSSGSNNYAGIQQAPALTVGKSYVVEFTITSYTSGYLKVSIGGGGGVSTYYSSVGTFTELFVYTAAHSSGKTVSFFPWGSFIGSIDNVSVKEITNAVEYKNIPQSARELYSLEDDTWVGNEELVVNGDFATDSDWIKSAGAYIINGIAGLSSQNLSSLSQNIMLQTAYYTKL